jgi:hypothetical protein
MARGEIEQPQSLTGFFPATRCYVAENPIRILTPNRAMIGAGKCPRWR